MSDDRPYTTNETHDGAMDLILGAASVTALSYEEVIAGYLRLRGIMHDDAKAACEPRFNALERTLEVLARAQKPTEQP